MPNKISLEEVKAKLPKFVKIYDETYKGVRYKAKFIDLEYNEEFEARIKSVIKLQHGCKSRSINLKSRSGLLARAKKEKFSLNDFKKLLPAYIFIYENTWVGLKFKVKLRDLEYNEDFEVYPFNVKRTGVCYCPSRRALEVSKKNTIPIETIQKRVDKIYGDGVIYIIPESYKGTNKMVEIIINGLGKFKYSMLHVLDGTALKERRKLNVWKSQVVEKWGKRCAISGAEKELQAHHIKSKSTSPELILEIANGIPLSKNLHNEFHSKYGKKHNTVYQLVEFAKEKGVDLIPRLKELNNIEINSELLPKPALES